MITHVYSDPHFGHANIIDYSQRPFDDVRQMNDALIELYNQEVNPEDTVLWLGDCFLMPFDEAAKTMSALHGDKILVPGNHDRSIRAMLKVGFTLVVPEASLLVDGRKCRCHHYPYVTKQDEEIGTWKGRPLRNHSEKGVILLHGHTHAKHQRHDDMVHVGVDAWEFRPVRLTELAKLLRKDSK